MNDTELPLLNPVEARVLGCLAEKKELTPDVYPLSLNAEGSLSLSLGSSTSGAEEIARLAEGARVAKAFNTYGWENFANPGYPGYGDLKPVLFHCSDDDEAKEIVEKLAKDLGFEPVDTGGLGMARSLEPLALMWIRLAIRNGRNPNFTWGMLKR